MLECRLEHSRSSGGVVMASANRPIASRFTAAEVAFLTAADRGLARIATVGADGAPHVTPVGHTYNPDHDSIDVGGINLERTKKFRDLVANPKVAIVIDDVLPPWKPRGIEVRGMAETIVVPSPVIRIRPDRIVSWGIENESIHHRHARNTTRRRTR